MTRYAFGWSDPRYGPSNDMSNYTKHDERIRRHFMAALSGTSTYMLVFACRFACAVAFNEAERAGREFSPIFWYMTDDRQIIMTLWEID